MKIDLEKKIDVYMFIIIVLTFVLIFCLIFSSYMKFTINKLLENQTRLEKPVITQPVNTYTNKYDTTPTATDKYKNYDY